MVDRELVDGVLKELKEKYKEQIADLEELREHLQDFEGCEGIACGECGDMHDRCITGTRNAVASLCSSDAWIIEQLGVLWKGFNHLEEKLEGKKDELDEVGEFYT